MTQKQLIIQYMKDFGTITTFQAFTDLGITKLRSDGHMIASEKLNVKNRYGKPVKFNKYWLEET